jgi:hypothetical protein
MICCQVVCHNKKGRRSNPPPLRGWMGHWAQSCALWKN